METVYMRDAKKLKALVHYVCWKTSDDRVLGAVKLNKSLFFSDLWTYVERGTPLTGEAYQKREHGPVSKSLLRVLDDLANEGAIFVRREVPPHKGRLDVIALTKPDITCFTSDEISLIDDAIHYVCYEHSAHEISEESHDIIWELAEIGEEIPYYAMLASELGEVTPEHLDWAKLQASKAPKIAAEAAA